MSHEKPRILDETYKASFLGKGTLNLLRVESPDVIEIHNDWHNPGAESYITDFTLHLTDGPLHLIAKACIKMSPRETMLEWLDRRKALEDNGVHTPELYSMHGATLIEEFIPFSFADAYTASTEKLELRRAFTAMYKRIIGAGFKPMSFHDTRSRGTDSVIVDLGEDLGGRQNANSCILEVADRGDFILKSLVEE
jgi:hypothetical protein